MMVMMMMMMMMMMKTMRMMITTTRRAEGLTVIFVHETMEVGMENIAFRMHRISGRRAIYMPCAVVDTL